MPAPTTGRRTPALAAFVALLLGALLIGSATAAAATGAGGGDEPPIDSGGESVPCDFFPGNGLPSCSGGGIPPADWGEPCLGPSLPCDQGGGGGGGFARETAEHCVYRALSDATRVGRGWVLPVLEPVAGSLCFVSPPLPSRIKTALIRLIDQGCEEKGYVHRLEFRYDGRRVTRVTAAGADHPALVQSSSLAET